MAMPTLDGGGRSGNLVRALARPAPTVSPTLFAGRNGATAKTSDGRKKGRETEAALGLNTEHRARPRRSSDPGAASHIDGMPIRQQGAGIRAQRGFVPHEPPHEVAVGRVRRFIPGIRHTPAYSPRPPGPAENSCQNRMTLVSRDSEPHPPKNGAHPPITGGTVKSHCITAPVEREPNLAAGDYVEPSRPREETEHPARGIPSFPVGRRGSSRKGAA